MVSITISVPEEVRELMKKFPEVNWSGLVRKIIIEKTEQLSLKEKFLKELKEEEDFNEWAVNLGRKVNQGIVKRLKKEKILDE